MYESVFSHYFSVDIESERIEHNDDESFLTNVEAFVEEKLSTLYFSESNRKYEIKDPTTQVISNMQKMLTTTDINTRIRFCESIATRLLNKEKAVQALIAQLDQDIQKGGLIVSSFKQDGNQYFAIVKIHYIDFYEESTFKENRGLPKKHVILKTSVCKIEDNQLQEAFYLSDSTKPKGSGAAKFWWDDFLELSPLINDKDNTKLVFSKVDDLLKHKFFKDTREDYWFFRNNLVSYLRTEAYFVFDTMIERTLGNLDIELLNDKSLDEKTIFKESLERNIRSLQDKEGVRQFDTEFTIDKKEVKAKIKRKITLLSNVELDIKGEIEDFKQSIVPGKDGERKFLKIYTNAGYDAFKSD